MRLLKDRRELSTAERRVALMRVAGSSNDAIAYMMEIDAGTIQAILKRPHVANFILLLHGVASDGLQDGIRDLNVAIEAAAQEAFDVEMSSMRELQEIGGLAIEPQHVIKAKVAAANIAQDVLDRAGKRAPTRVVTANLKANIPDAQVQQLVRVMDEMK